jgi:hypothetical protein
MMNLGSFIATGDDNGETVAGSVSLAEYTSETTVQSMIAEPSQSTVRHVRVQCSPEKLGSLCDRQAQASRAAALQA